MTINTWAVTAAVATLFAAASDASAQPFRTDLTWDRVELNNGRVIRGSAAWTEDRLHVRLPLGSITLPRSSVRAVRLTHDPLQELERQERAGLPFGAVADRVRFARFCVHYELTAKARSAWLGVLRLDPDHAEARRALGYVQQDGRWMTPDDAKRARGLIEFRGAWMTPRDRRRILDEERTARLIREKLRKERALREAKLRAIRAEERAANARAAAARAEAAAARARAEREAIPTVLLSDVAVCPPRRGPYWRPRYRPFTRPYRRPSRRILGRPVTRPYCPPQPVRPCRDRPRTRDRVVAPSRPSPVRVIRPRNRPAPRIARGRYLLRHQVNRGPGVRR